MLNGTLDSERREMHGFEQSLVLTLPPLSVLYLKLKKAKPARKSSLAPSAKAAGAGSGKKAAGKSGAGKAGKTAAGKKTAAKKAGRTE